MIDQQDAQHVPGGASRRGGITCLFAGMLDKRISLLLFLLVFFCCSYFVQIDSWNQTSRMALIMSVVHRHQLNIDPYEQSTGDKALYNDHYYSDKAIGTAVLGVPVYAAYSALRGFEDYSVLHNSYPVTVMVVALPSAILSVLLYQLLRMMGSSRAWALLLCLFYSFGTLAFPFSTMLFGHQVAAAFAFAAFYALVIARLHRSSGWLLLLAGTLAGLAVLTEYQVLLITIFLFLYAATFVRPKRQLGLYILGGAPWAALLLVYNWYTFSSPFTFAYSYVDNAQFEAMHTGLFGITWPQWSSFIEITIGQRGLLMQSVFLWLLPLGVWLMSRTVQWRRECVLCVGVGLAFLIWNSAYYLPFGGMTPGARFLVPSLPFLIVPLSFVAQLRRTDSLLTRWILLFTGICSMGLYFLICVTNPLVPEKMGCCLIPNPLRDYWLPRFADEHLALNLGMLVFGLHGIESLAPLAMVFVVTLTAFVLLIRSHLPAGEKHPAS